MSMNKIRKRKKINIGRSQENLNDDTDNPIRPPEGEGVVTADGGDEEIHGVEENVATTENEEEVAGNELEEDDYEQMFTETISSINARGELIKWSKNGFGQSVPAAPSNGKFTEEESVLVKQAIEEYCNIKQIEIKKFCYECDHKSVLRGAWVEIAQRLPSRSVQAIYRHGMRLLHPFKRGVWTKEEINTLLQSVIQIGQKWAVIQLRLQRSADSCRDKYREISGAFNKGRWQEDEVESFKNLIREYLQADSHATISDLKRMVDQRRMVMPWSRISRRLGSRSRLSCLKKWESLVDGTNDRLPKKDINSSSSTIAHSLPPSVPTVSKVKKRTTNRQNDSSKQMNDPNLTASSPVKTTSTSSKTKKRKKNNLPTLIPIEVTTSNTHVPSSLQSGQPMDDKEGTSSYDRALLSQIASSSYQRESDVQWSSMHYPYSSSFNRWRTLCDELFESIMDPNVSDELEDKPICQLAKIILEKKSLSSLKQVHAAVESSDNSAIATNSNHDVDVSLEEEEQAKIAAQTVEAVFL